MIQWEYEISFVEGWELQNKLIKFGEDGWELAGTFTDNISPPITLIFKRPKATHQISNYRDSRLDPIG